MSIDKARAVFGGQEIYTEETGDAKSPIVEISRDGNRSITRTLILHAPEDIDTLIDECLPSFVAPGKHPSNQPFYVDRIRIQPLGKARDGYAQSGETNLGYALHEKYIATITYTGVPYDLSSEDPQNPGQPNPEQFLTVSIDSTGQYDIVPQGSLYWNNGEKIDSTISAGVVLVSDTRYSLTKINRSRGQIPFAKAEAMKGKVNAAAYAATHFAFPSCPAETVLFTGLRVEVSVDSLGVRKYSYTLDFWKRNRIIDSGASDIGWNEFYDPTTQTYRKAYLAPGGNAADLVYKSFSDNDLRELLIPPA